MSDVFSEDFMDQIVNVQWDGALLLVDFNWTQQGFNTPAIKFFGLPYFKSPAGLTVFGEFVGEISDTGVIPLTDIPSPAMREHLYHWGQKGIITTINSKPLPLQPTYRGFSIINVDKWRNDFPNTPVKFSIKYPFNQGTDGQVISTGGSTVSGFRNVYTGQVIDHTAIYHLEDTEMCAVSPDAGVNDISVDEAIQLLANSVAPDPVFHVQGDVGDANTIADGANAIIALGNRVDKVNIGPFTVTPFSSVTVNANNTTLSVKTAILTGSPSLSSAALLRADIPWTSTLGKYIKAIALTSKLGNPSISAGALAVNVLTGTTSKIVITG